MSDHRKLQVWQRAHTLSVIVYRATESLGDNAGTHHYQSQLRRAAASVAANIAEGRGQETAAQFGRYLSVAIGSANEALSHCAELQELSLIEERSAQHIHRELEEIRAMLLGLRRKLRE